MGFKVPKRTALLVFEGEYAGAEVRCRLDVPISLYLDYMGMDASSRDSIQAGYGRWGEEVLIEWNLEDDDGQPLPATGGGFLSLPPRLAGLIVQHWLESAAEVPAPLGGTSTNGVSSEVPSIPMAAL